MANEFKIKKGLIVTGSGGTLLDVQGSVGQVFSVTDSLTGDIFSVSDVSGIPIFNVNSSGAITFDGYIPDNNNLSFGNSSDLQIYHDGSNSYIKDTGAGNLWIQGSTQVNIGGANGEIGVQYVENAGVGLRHNNVTKLSTESTGVIITGSLSASERIQVGTKTSGDSSIISQNSDIQLRIGSTSYEISPYIRFQGKSDDGDGTYTNVYSDIKLDTVNEKLVFNDPGNVSGTIGTNPMTLDNSGNLNVNGNISLSGTQVAIGTNAYAKKIYRNTPTISSSSYTTVATVNGSGLGSAIRMTVMGTSGNVVLANIAEIIVNHSTDILIKTTNSFYSRLFIKITSDNNEDFAIGLKRSGDTNDTGIQLEIEPLNDEEVTFTNSHSFTGATLEHESHFGEVTSHTDTAGNSYHKSMKDNQKIKFGDANDLEILHDASNSRIQTVSASAGDLYVESKGSGHDLYLKAADDIYIQPQAGENGIILTGNSSVHIYYNSAKKIMTQETGAIVYGTLTAEADVIAYSDARLKTDVKNLDGNKVYKMRGVSFIKDDKKGSGVIAQEMQEVAPELVKDDGEYLGVAYGNITGYLIEAIKDLKQEVEQLKKQIK